MADPIFRTKVLVGRKVGDRRIALIREWRWGEDVGCGRRLAWGDVDLWYHDLIVERLKFPRNWEVVKNWANA